MSDKKDQAIRFTIRSNDGDTHQSNPDWMMLVIKYTEPCAAYTYDKDLTQSQEILIRQDILSVSVSNQKASFGKTCSINLKNSKVQWQNVISPGDWVFIWMHEDSDKLNKVSDLLQSKNFETNALLSSELSNKSGSTPNDWNSGLKFVGKVLSVHNSDSISSNGVKTVTSSISAQAFLEFASSIYFTGVGKSVIETFLRNNVDIADSYFLKKERFKEIKELLETKMLAERTNLKSPFTPDLMILYLMILLMGMQKDDLAGTSLVGGLKFGTYSEAISIPFSISKVLGLKDAKYAHKLYRYVGGIQKYSSAKDPWVSFYPLYDGNKRGKFDASNEKTPGVKLTSDRCKGWIGYKPTSFSNTAYWNAFSQYLNPATNEMYTVLKCDDYGRILPHLIVREIPFSTGLFNSLQNNVQNELEILKQNRTIEQSSVDKIKEVKADKTPDLKIKESKTLERTNTSTPLNTNAKTYYWNLPRWTVDESALISLDVSTDESKRINFCQVFANNIALNSMAGPAGISVATQGQIVKGNFVADFNDIKRHGVRADIIESEFDYPIPGDLTSSPLWSRLRADWYFNGHLKLAGSATLLGVSYPICEGDNVEIRGVVYHIESVNHSCQRSANGTKSFRTTLGLSNGILAESLTSNTSVPKYICHRDINASSQVNNNAGLTLETAPHNPPAEDPVKLGKLPSLNFVNTSQVNAQLDDMLSKVNNTAKKGF